MSLQFQTVRGQFVQDCVQLWSNWLQPPGNAAARQMNRQNRLRAAITRMVGFMPAPTVSFPAMNDWGSFNRASWTLKVTGTKMHGNIKYQDFVELCSTVYHETRHCEQWYRVAQGLASGRIDFPDQSGARTIQNLAVAGVGDGSVRSRISAFEGRTFQQDPAARQTLIAQWMNIPANVVDHAVIHQSFFDNFTQSTRPAWFKRDSIVKEVEDWMRTRYKMTQNELTSWLQGDDGPYRMYRNLPTEHDAHEIERAVQTGIKLAIGHDNPTDLAKRRNDVATFGP